MGQNNNKFVAVYNSGPNVPMNIGKTMPQTQRSINLRSKGNNINNQSSQNQNSANNSANLTGSKISRSFNFDLVNSTRPNLPYSMIEHPQKNGCDAVYACGPLSRQRYINPKLEKELVDFKKEVEDKFSKSLLSTFAYPRISLPHDSQDDLTLINIDHNNDLSQFLSEAEVNYSKAQRAPKTVRKLLDHTSFLNYQTEGLGSANSNMQPSINMSINYEQMHENGGNNSNLGSIPILKKNQKYDQQLENILKNSGVMEKTAILRKLENHNNQNHSRFKDGNSSFKMPDLINNNMNRSRYQENDSQLHGSSKDRSSKVKTHRYPQNIPPVNHKMSNIINVNNPQVIIQSPQNNTIILVDGASMKDSNSRNIINQLEKSGLISGKYENHSKDNHINKRNLQQSRIFDNYVKNQKILNNSMNPTVNLVNNNISQNASSRNQMNVSTTKNRAKYETNNRSMARNYQYSVAEKDQVSKSFIFPPSSLGKKQL
ncbi:UNKNOWN [Stylonychia lemnae]|uniref:Uncharacterized protein n=1 Tax=Stylonychia lemnae TaxID=5949 RepID=A0A077ZYI3_STYLE|nr:UNKNOWN [Stylonychia lemnae]|eukprot:CDW74935.1 UNKNOWN [Stylonychia lemnae]